MCFWFLRNSFPFACGASQTSQTLQTLFCTGKDTEDTERYHPRQHEVFLPRAELDFFSVAQRKQRIKRDGSDRHNAGGKKRVCEDGRLAHISAETAKIRCKCGHPSLQKFGARHRFLWENAECSNGFRVFSGAAPAKRFFFQGWRVWYPVLFFL